MESAKKAKIISMRLTKDQFDYLDRMAKRIRHITGANVTRSSIILKLMEYGLPHMEEEFPKPAEETQGEDFNKIA